MARPKALVAGALGIVGRNLCEDLLADGRWDVVGIARRSPKQSVGWRLAPVDLTDAGACRALIVSEPGITHLFYAARAPDPDPATEAALNQRMLENLVVPLDELAQGLEHVNLMHGTKWYGSHFGPYRTPAKESDPRHFPPNFYFDQLDWTEARQRGGRWTWSALRPHVVCGYSLGYPHNVIAVLGVYAAVSRELGLPLRFPGTQACFDAVCQMTDARILAQAMRWAATEPRAANQSFNIVNGDLFRWKNLWEKLARHFRMENGGVQTVPLAKLMADKEPLWASIVKKHGLRPLAMAEIANWTYADSTFSQGWDHISSPMKSRLAGFQACIDTEDMFIEHLERFRMEKVIP